jgi:sugar/nucleoside kinase (ribokinase family)
VTKRSLQEPLGAKRSGVKRLGVIGTFVWDVIHGRDPLQVPVEEWGGITYALGALDAALADDWEIAPIIKVGSDLASEAREYLKTLKRVARDVPPIEVPYPNNRVTLYYHSSERRSEYLRGGIPGWQWLGLKPLLRGIDALYINFISGMELDLETAQLIRQNFDGLIYCDLHSLLLAVNPDGLRTPRAIPQVLEWLRCFDLLQVNEDEMHLLASDPMELAATAMGEGVAEITVTLGSRGVVYFAIPDLEQLFQSDARSRKKFPTTGGSSGPIRTSFVPAPLPRDPNQLDPTGCGDVWGATYFARLLAGDKLGDAMAAAMTAAVKNVNYRGASGLANYLRGEITVK